MTGDRPVITGRWIASVIGIALVAWLLLSGFRFMREPWRLNEDSRQQTYVYYRAANPALFPGDPITDYMTRYQPPLYRYAQMLSARLIDPVVGGKTLHLAVMLAAALAAGLVGLRAGGPAVGLAAATLVAFSGYFHDRASGGLARAFGAPLILGCIAAGVWNRWRIAAALTVLSAGLYPPATLVTGPFVLLTAPWKTERKLVLTLAAATAILLQWSHWRPPWIGYVFRFGEAAAMPEWSRHGGRFREFPWFANGIPHVLLSPIYWWVKNDLSVMGGALVGSVIALAVRFRHGRTALADGGVGKTLRLFLLPIPILFVAACLLAFRLFLPERVIEVGLPPVFWLAVVIVPSALVRSRYSETAAAAAAGAAALATVAVALIQGNALLRYDHTPQSVRALCAKVETLPADAVIAGPPNLMDFVPIYARRAVYVDFETAHPLYDGYHRMISERFGVLAELYYAGDAAQARTMARAAGITHLVVDRADFDADPRHFPKSFQPYEGWFATAKASRNRYLFDPPPASAVVAEVGSKDHAWVLIDIARL